MVKVNNQYYCPHNCRIFADLWHFCSLYTIGHVPTFMQLKSSYLNHANKDIKCKHGAKFKTDKIHISVGGLYSTINAIFGGFTNRSLSRFLIAVYYTSTLLLEMLSLYLNFILSHKLFHEYRTCNSYKSCRFLFFRILGRFAGKWRNKLGVKYLNCQYYSMISMLLESWNEFCFKIYDHAIIRL